MLSLVGIGDGGIVDAVAFGVVVLVVASLIAHKASKDKYAGVNVPPGDTGLPFIGNALEVRVNVTYALQSRLPSLFFFFLDRNLGIFLALTQVLCTLAVLPHGQILPCLAVMTATHFYRGLQPISTPSSNSTHGRGTPPVSILC